MYADTNKGTLQPEVVRNPFGFSVFCFFSRDPESWYLLISNTAHTTSYIFFSTLSFLKWRM